MKRDNFINSIYDIDFEFYKDKYSESGLVSSLIKYASKLAKGTVANALKIYYAIKSGKLDAKSLIFAEAALGYLISPIDFIPDFLPGGLLDDIAVLSLVISMLVSKGVINADINKKVDKAMKGNSTFSSLK